MILALNVPFLESSVRGGAIYEWLMRPGDQVAFGDAVCTVAVDEALALRRDKRATNLSRSMTSSQAQRENRYEWRQRRGLLIVEIVASETAFLRQVLAEAGKRVLVGETLALMTTVDHEALDDRDNPHFPSMRVTARAKEES